MIQGLRLEKLRWKLRDMRDDLRQEIVRRGETIREDVKDPGDITDIPTHEADHDVPDVPREVEVGIIQTTMLDQVESALARIENETHGRCERCARPGSASRRFPTHRTASSAPASSSAATRPIRSPTSSSRPAPGLLLFSPQGPWPRRSRSPPPRSRRRRAA